MQEWPNLLAISIAVRAWVLFVWKLTEWELLNKYLFPVQSLTSLQFSQHAATGELTEAALAEKLSKLRWSPKARNAVEYYWGMPGEQVSMELAFSSGSQAQTHRQMCLPIARRQTHLQNLPLYPRHFPHTHSGMWLIHHPSTCRVSPTHTISCNSVPLLSFHFPTFFPMLLVLTIFPQYHFPTVLMYKTAFCWKVIAVKYGKKWWKYFSGLLFLHHFCTNPKPGNYISILSAGQNT